MFKPTLNRRVGFLLNCFVLLTKHSLHGIIKSEKL